MEEKIREAFRKFAETTTGWQLKDTHIKKISVRTFSSRIKKHIVSDICVGQELDDNLVNLHHVPVAGIFEANDYFVVTPDRGDLNGTVYLFEGKEVVGIEREG